MQANAPHETARLEELAKSLSLTLCATPAARCPSAVSTVVPNGQVLQQSIDHGAIVMLVLRINDKAAGKRQLCFIRIEHGRDSRSRGSADGESLIALLAQARSDKYQLILALQQRKCPLLRARAIFLSVSGASISTAESALLQWPHNSTDLAHSLMQHPLGNSALLILLILPLGQLLAPRTANLQRASAPR